MAQWGRDPWSWDSWLYFFKVLTQFDQFCSIDHNEKVLLYAGPAQFKSMLFKILTVLCIGSPTCLCLPLSLPIPLCHPSSCFDIPITAPVWLTHLQSYRKPASEVFSEETKDSNNVLLCNLETGLACIVSTFYTTCYLCAFFLIYPPR